ncbi:MAG: ankyrin repeat domain-containing protein [Verrucomicrobiia bacterium]
MNPFARFLVLSSLACLWFAACGPVAPKTSLHEAVQDGNLYLVKKHIAAKTDLNKPDSSGWTPLHLAAMNGSLPIVQALTEAGADSKRKGTGGKTPLDVAREKRQAAVVQYLQQQTPRPAGGRGLIDGGLGVSEVLDNP